MRLFSNLVQCYGVLSSVDAETMFGWYGVSLIKYAASKCSVSVKSLVSVHATERQVTSEDKASNSQLWRRSPATPATVVWSCRQDEKWKTTIWTSVAAGIHAQSTKDRGKTIWGRPEGCSPLTSNMIKPALQMRKHGITSSL